MAGFREPGQNPSQQAVESSAGVSDQLIRASATPASFLAQVRAAPASNAAQTDILSIKASHRCREAIEILKVFKSSAAHDFTLFVCDWQGVVYAQACETVVGRDA